MVEKKGDNVIAALDQRQIKPMLSNPISGTYNNTGSLFSNGADKNTTHNMINLVESSVSKTSDRTGTQRSLQLKPKLLRAMTPYENFL